MSNPYKARGCCLAAVASLVMIPGLLANRCYAQDSSSIGDRFVPDDALVVAIASPAELVGNPALAMFPIEIFRAQAIEQVGIDPLKISLVKAVAGLPGPAGPQFGLVIQFDQDVVLAPLLEMMEVEPNPLRVGQYAAYRIPAQVDMVLHQLDARTLVLASPSYLEAVITAESGTGKLAKLAAQVRRQNGIMVLAAIEPVRPMIGGIAQQQASQLPPPLQPLGELPMLIDALLLHSELNGQSSSLALTMLCGDDASATKLETVLNDSMKFGRQVGIAEASKALATSGQSEAVRQATMQYSNRMADMIITTLTPTREGRKVVISLESSTGIAGAGMLVGLLLPAVQAAREAARRMNASNHIKQIMLGFHNYHSATGSLPPAAITDAGGQPLLSWRVALLPYLEQQALYAKFHLDEAWDSEHNFPLSQQLPTVYEDPSAVLPPGYTVMQAVVSESSGLKLNQSVAFSEFTDGLSHSLLVIESKRDAAVPWSKPDDILIDPSEPLAVMGNSHPGGFHVGMADGAVKFITYSVDTDLFRALMTRAGGEVVRLDQ